MPNTSSLKAPKKEQAGNFIDHLVEDHKHIMSLFNKFEAADAKKQKQKIAHQILTELMIHMQIEEEILYAAMREMGPESIGVMMNEAEEEHHVAKGLMKEIEQYGSEDGHYDAKVVILREVMEHHFQEEEGDGGIFKKAKRLTGIKGITERLASRKKELSHQYNLKKFTEL